MSVDCYCDYGDPPAFYNATLPRARKKHRCLECGGPIVPGERYERVVGKWSGYGVDTFHTCERCYDLRIWTKNNVPCLCIMHGDMDDQIRNSIDDAYERSRDEVKGLWFGYARRMVARKRHNEAAKIEARK